MSPAHAAGESKHHLDAGLKVLICSITGFHSACSVSVRGPATAGGVVAQDVVQRGIGTPSELPQGGARGLHPRRKREARPDTTTGSPSRRPN